MLNVDTYGNKRYIEHAVHFIFMTEDCLTSPETADSVQADAGEGLERGRDAGLL